MVNRASVQSPIWKEKKKEGKEKQPKAKKAKQNKSTKKPRGVCLGYFSCCCNKVPNINNFMEKEFILVHNFVTFCLSHFLIAISKHHDQVNMGLMVSER